jgi:hypothetical protein
MMAPCGQMLYCVGDQFYSLTTQYFMKITVTLPEHYKDVMFCEIFFFYSQMKSAV